MEKDLSFIGIAINKFFDLMERKPVLLVPILLPLGIVIVNSLLTQYQYSYSKPTQEMVKIEQVVLNYIELDGEVRTLIVNCPRHKCRMTVYNNRLWQTSMVGDVLNISYQDVIENSSGKLVGYIHTIGSEKIGQVFSDKE